MKSTRHTYSPEYKLETVMEVLCSEKSVAQICREWGLRIRCCTNGNGNLKRVPAGFLLNNGSRVRMEIAKDTKIAELERNIGKLTVENTILKKPRVCWDRIGGATDDD